MNCKALFMTNSQQHLEALSDIRRIMDRSSRFLSLSGLSGVGAGIIALIGTYVAKDILDEYYRGYEAAGFQGSTFVELRFKLTVVAAVVFIMALAIGYYFTWRKTKQERVRFWESSTRRLIMSLFIPLAAGGVFIFGMLMHSEWRFVSPACLIFYGLALLNASKYTLDEIRYLAYCEIVLGLINVWMPGKGLYFWGLGFGVLHIVYGIVMWRKYDRKQMSS